ncbi:unnamed protein product [Blepharisma stoltei]|uniref:DUF4378 domain-containing protein n=1 Tax=Blepharisma stoltei TaxID=1481888 RepID=A0AAU9JNG8_9CILI|nr:unnamed protein product [Blepharisma stoltei]
MLKEVRSLEPSLSISPLSLYAPSLLSPEHTEIFKSFGTARTPSVPVLGRRITSESVVSPSNESTSRFPIPVVIQSPKLKFLSPQPTKKAINYFQDTQKPKKEIKRKVVSKTPEPIKISKPVAQPLSKQPSITLKQKIPRKSSATPQPTSITHKEEVKIEKPAIEEIPQKGSIEKIISKTLRKQKLSKDLAEKRKYDEMVKQQRNKRELEQLNKQTRLENKQRFKKNEFKPKVPWGADERRIMGETDEKTRREAEEMRKKQRESREKNKQMGKARIGMDNINWKSPERAKTSRSHKDEEKQLEKKSIKQPNPEILEFMRYQKKLRKLQKELDSEKIREEESKRISQLNHLESQIKSNLNKFKKKKQKEKKKEKVRKKILKKKPVKPWVEESDTNYPEDEEVKGIMYGMPPETSSSYNREGRECQVFGHYPDVQAIEERGNATQLVNDIVERRVHQESTLPIGSVTMPILEVKETTPTYTEDVSEELKLQELQSSDLSRRKDEIRKKLAELKNRVDRAREIAKDSTNEEEIKNQAAVRIQAWTRGWLTREALRRFFENLESSDDTWLYKRLYGSDGQVSFEDEDEEVQKILRKIGKPDNFTNGSSWEESDHISPRTFNKLSNGQKWEESNAESQFARLSPVPVKKEWEDSAGLDLDSHFRKFSPVPAAISSHELERLREEGIKNGINKEKQKEIQEILESQMQWRIHQKQKLKELKEKDMQDIEKIAKKVGNDKETMKFFQEIIERRYSHINQIFDENIEAVKSALSDNLENADEESLIKTFEQRKQLADKLIEQKNSGILEKALGDVINSQEKEWDNYSDSASNKSVRVSELDIENNETEENKEEKKSIDIDELSPCQSKKPADISNSFIEQIKALQFPIPDKSPIGQDSKFIDSIFHEIKNVIAEERDSPEFNALQVEKFLSPELENSISIDSEPIICEFSEESSQSFKSFQGDAEIQSSAEKNAQEISKSFEEGLDLNTENSKESSSEKNDSSSLIEYEASPRPNLIVEPGGTPYLLSDNESHSKNSSPINKNSAILIQEWSSPENSNCNIPEEPSIENPDLECLIDMEKFQEKIARPFDEAQCEEMLISDALENMYNGILSEFVYETIKQLLISPDFLVKITDFIIFDLIVEEVRHCRPYEMPIIDISVESPKVISNTDENAVRQYTEKLLNFVLQSPEIAQESLLTPICRNPLDQLSKMQENEIGTAIIPDPPADPVLSPNFYDKLEKEAKPDALAEAESIHNKMIFDAINENLQQYRKNGEKGVPMPWSNRSPSTSNILNIYEIFSQVRDNILECSKIRAGTIPEFDLNASVSTEEEILRKIREEKLARLLTLEVMENDQQWVDYEFEETQVKLDLADMMLEQLVAEVVEILYVN